MCTCKGSILRDQIKFVIFMVLCVLCPKIGYFLDRPRTVDRMGPSISRRGHQIDDNNCKHCLLVKLDFGLTSNDWSQKCVKVYSCDAVKVCNYFCVT